MRYSARPYLRNTKRRPLRRGRSITVLFLLLLLWSICLGWGLSVAATARSSNLLAQGSPPPSPQTSSTVGTVDVVPDRLKLGQSLYLENCATCHIGLPPAIMPTETWRQLLQDSEHYGANLKPLTSPYIQVVWEYIRYFSRPQDAEDETPYRIYQSKYFKILHPRVKLPSRAGLSTCISCHPGAGKYDFRTLSSEWQNAP